jgi:ubiquinone biosynthesis protein Coq4
MLASSSPTIADTAHQPFAYQTQDSALTLRDGLAEYYRVNPGLVTQDQASPAAKIFFRSHDACHVIFGTDTSIDGEGLTDWWTVFAVDIRARDYLSQSMKVDEVTQIFKDIPLSGYARVFLSFFTQIPRIWRASRRMTKKWPWTDLDAYLDRPLGELRAEFGIVVIFPRATTHTT